MTKRRNHRPKPTRRAASKLAIESVPMTTIFAWALGNAAAGIEPGFAAIAEHVEALMPVWGHRKAGDVTEENRDEYIKGRKEAVSSTGETYEKYSFDTVNWGFSAMLTMIRAYARRHRIKFTLTIRHVPREIAPVHRTLTREEIIRLVAACRGREWDGETMRRKLGGDAFKDLRLRRAGNGRYILLAALMGVPHVLARRLRWKSAEQMAEEAKEMETERSKAVADAERREAGNEGTPDLTAALAPPIGSAAVRQDEPDIRWGSAVNAEDAIKKSRRQKDAERKGASKREKGKVQQHSWVDLTTLELHRLGPDLPKLRAYHNKSVRIPKWLAKVMALWRDHDLALGITYVLGTDHELITEANLRPIARAAGVPGANPALLIDTFAANALRTFGVSLIGVALALGRETRRVKAKYGHYQKNWMAEAVAGVRARSPAFSHRKPSSAGVAKKKPKRPRRDGGRAA